MPRLVLTCAYRRLMFSHGKTLLSRSAKKQNMEITKTLSLFYGYKGLEPTETTLEQIIGLIRRDADIAARTENYRRLLRQGHPEAAAREKAGCSCFAVSVRFNGGKRKEHIESWTHLCMADFDHIPEERMKECLRLVREDPHTLLAYMTISGTGLRVIAAYKAADSYRPRSEQELHLRAFGWINEHYAKLTGLPYDEKCKNSTRLSGLAHDPEAYYAPAAVPFAIAKPLPGESLNRLKTQRMQLRRIVREAERLLDEEGIAYTAHHHNEYIMRMGYLLNAYGADEETATRWARERFADYDGDVEGILRSCYRRTEEHGTRSLARRTKSADASSGQKRATVNDIEAFLTRQGRFRKNTVTGKYEFAPEGTDEFKDLTDREVNSLWRSLCKEVAPVHKTELQTVIESDFVPLFNPFREYVDALPEWDGVTDHIGLLSARVRVKQGAELFDGYFKKWLVAMLAALLDENTVNHEILVLIGRQGIYKTTFLNNLLPPELRRYFYLKSNSRNISKDDLLTLSEFAVVCLEELDEMDDRELNQLKALTTMRHVNERAAYARYKEMRPHIASFCGTSNNRHFLNDLSGNRRWMPFEVESIDSPYDHPVDYTQVFAQAYALSRNGYRYWLDDDEITKLNLHNRQFEVPCLERELILTHYRRPMDGEECIFVTNAQILARINAGLRHGLSPVKIGMVMSQEGFQHVRIGGKRGYRVVELTGDEIYRNQQALARLLGNG